MTRPDSLFEAASYDLNKFIERRVTERRAVQREALDRRQQPILQEPEHQTMASDTPENIDQTIPSH